MSDNGDNGNSDDSVTNGSTGTNDDSDGGTSNGDSLTDSSGGAGGDNSLTTSDGDANGSDGSSDGDPDDDGDATDDGSNDGDGSDGAGGNGSGTPNGAGGGSNPTSVNFQSSEAGTFAGHPIRMTLPAAVAPTTENEKNTLRDPLVVVGCGLLPDYFFLFDSSFIGPNLVEHMPYFNGLLQDYPNCPISIFGHTDPVGPGGSLASASSDTYNYMLGGCRAASWYAMLTRNPAIWDDIYTRSGQYTQVALGDQWGDQVLQSMLSVVTDPSGTPYYSGPTDGSANSDYTNALQQWRSDNNVTPGPQSRQLLYSRYFDTVCVVGSNGQAAQLPADASTVTQVKLQPSNFLAQGAGNKGKGDYQSCSRFNPQLVFSSAEDAAYQQDTDHTARNKDNQPNRRVIALFFREGTKIDPTKWPCPSIITPTGYQNTCYTRFWAKTTDTDLIPLFSNPTLPSKVYQDGNTRRFPQQCRRTFTCTKDTFACRFYHGLVVNSPCEDKQQWNLRLLLRPPKVGFADKPHAGERYVVYLGQGDMAPQMRGTTDKNGKLGIHAPDSEDDDITMTLKTHWSWVDNSYYKPRSHTPDPPSTDETKYLAMTLTAGALQQMDDSTQPPVCQRLTNLYYGPLTGYSTQIPDPNADTNTQPNITDQLTSAEGYFEKHQQLATNTPDSQVRQRLKEVYGS